MLPEFVENFVYAIESEWPRYLILVILKIFENRKIKKFITRFYNCHLNSFLKTVWLLINFICFLSMFFYYQSALEYFYLRKMVQVRS
jgi:hypothetical protein